MRKKYRSEGLRILKQHDVYPFDWINFTDWEDGLYHRADLVTLVRNLKLMSVSEIREHQIGAAHEQDLWKTYVPSWWLAGQRAGESKYRQPKHAVALVAPGPIRVSTALRLSSGK